MPRGWGLAATKERGRDGASGLASGGYLYDILYKNVMK